MFSRAACRTLLGCALTAGWAVPGWAQEPGLLFHLSGEKGLTAETAGGDPAPTFLRNVSLIDDGALGRGVRCAPKARSSPIARLARKQALELPPFTRSLADGRLSTRRARR
jgi:hypothetical protein